MKADVSIAQNSGTYKIRVIGRATFECSAPVRNLAKNLDRDGFECISIDLKGCTGMDSTFMGVLAMLGLRAMKQKATMEVLNANDDSRDLLDGLGLSKLFTFRDEAEATTPDYQSVCGQLQEEKSNTVLEAHEVLMEVDEANIPKFEKVVELVRKDIEK